jgi:hypothetical protein
MKVLQKDGKCVSYLFFYLGQVQITDTEAKLQCFV